MTDTVHIEIEDSRELIALYTGSELSGEVADAVALGMDRANLVVLGNIQHSRFTGNGPFPVSLKKLGRGKVRGGRLVRSLRTTKARVVNADAINVRSTMGSRVKYFGRHEFGFSGTESVRSHTRRTRSGGTAKVRAFTRKVNTPERMPLRAGLAERQNARVYDGEIGDAVSDVLSGKK